MKPPDYAFIGNAAHWLCIASTLGYAFTVVTRIEMFDPSWQQDGFCVANKEQEYWTSHDMCFYYDTVAAVILTAVYYMLKDESGMEFANRHIQAVILGVFAHGIGHGAIARTIRTRESDVGMSTTGLDLMEDMDARQIIVELIPFFLFWVGLLKSSMSNVKLPMVMVIAVLAFGMHVYVPVLYSVTYVQSVLLLCFSLNELAQPSDEKGFSYALYAILGGFPVTLVGWLESTQCSSFVKDYFYGHLIYDGYIPPAVLVWYLASYVNATTSSKVKRA